MKPNERFPRLCHILRMKDEPDGYIAWHEWAEKKLKRFKQVKCKSCGLFHNWVKRESNLPGWVTRSSSLRK